MSSRTFASMCVCAARSSMPGPSGRSVAELLGKLLGHTQVQTTARYAHLARDSIQNAAARITESIGGNLISDTHGDQADR